MFIAGRLGDNVAVAPAMAEDGRAQRLFLRSLNPMLLADDERRYVDANAAACLFLRLEREEICKLSIDDLTPPEMRAGAQARWAAFLQGRHSNQTVMAQSWDLQMPDGSTVAVRSIASPRNTVSASLSAAGTAGRSGPCAA